MKPRILSFRRFIRSYSRDFFSKSPLNYETYENRLKRFTKLYKEPNQEPKSYKGPLKGSLKGSRKGSDQGSVPVELFLDCIKANRELQSQKSFPTHTREVLDDTFLGRVDNSGLENKLWSLLFTKYHQGSINQVVKSYISTPPSPVKKIFKVTSVNFQSNLKQLNGKLINFKHIDKSVIYTALNKLLDNKDYYGGFKLVENTLESREYLRHRKQLLTSAGVGLGMFNLVVTAVETLFLPSIPPLLYLLMNVLLSLGLVYGLLQFQIIQHLGRLSWRPHNSKLYNYIHHEELVAFNKIITHFEEHNEVNIRNFHHSKVRKLSNLKMFDQNDYILELPNSSTELATIDSFHEETDILQLQQFFKFQLNSRKMVLNDLLEELMFLEFWLTHGENFDWVEPDQDPAEILKLEITSLNNG